MKYTREVLLFFVFVIRVQYRTAVRLSFLQNPPEFYDRGVQKILLHKMAETSSDGRSSCHRHHLPGSIVGVFV